MDAALLEDIGLSPREAKAYQALLELGLTTVGPLIKKSGVPSSKIYETLDRLAKKGFVSSVVKDGRKHFQAAPPEQILSFLEERKERISEELVPKLKALQLGRREYGATAYEGLRGLKSVYERMLREVKKNEEILVLGAPLKAQELLEPFLLNWNKRRIKKKIAMRVIYHPEAKKYAEIRARMPLTQVRYAQRSELAPSWIDIFADFVVIFDLSQDTPLAFFIQSKGIAENYRIYFEDIWQSSVKS